MADDEKDVKLNFSAETTKAIENVDTLQKKINDLYDTVEKVNKAGINNHNTLTSRQSSQVIRGAGSASEAAKEVSNQSRQLEGAYSSARESGALSPSELNQLKQIIDLLHSSISQANASGVSSSGRVSPVGAYGQMYQNLSGMHVRPSKIFLEGTSREERYSQAEERKQAQEEQRGMRRDVNHYSRSATHYSDSVDTAISRGRVTYNRNKELNGQYDSALGGISSQQENVRSQLEGASGRRQDIGAEMDQLRQSISQGKVSGDGQAEADRLNKLEQEDKELAQTIANLKAFNDTLKQSRQNLNSAKARYDNSTENGNTSVGYDPNSFMGMMQRRMPSTIIGATSTALSGLRSSSQSGNQSRMEAENSINADTLGSIANGTGSISHRSDVRYLSQLSNRGITNGTDYTGTQMAQFAGNFTNATGNTSTSASVSAANSTSQLARFTGMGTSQANELIGALGTSGAISNGNNTSEVSNTIAGEVYSSRMAGKSPQQAQALSSIINGQANIGVTTRQAGDLAAVQGMQAKYGSTMQGSAGGSAYTGLSSIATSGFNNPVSRALFGGNNPKYAGVHGSALLYRDMTQATSHPWQLGSMIRNDLNNFGGDRQATAANLSQLSGGKLSYKQALNYVNMQQKGQLNRSNIERQRNRDNRTGRNRNQHIRRQYSTQGNSTIDLRISIDQRGKIAMSNAGDGARRAGNSVGSHIPALLWGTGAAVGGASAALLSKGLGTLIMSRLGGKGLSGIAGISNLLKGTKLGGAMSSASSWFKGTKAGSTVISGVGKGKSILSGLGDTVKGSRFGQYASKASDLFKGSTIMQGMRTAGSAAKDSKMFGGASKLFGGASKVLGKIATPLAVAGYASDAITNKNHLKGASEGVGGIAGTIAGGIFGGPLGAVAGGWAGEKLGAGVYDVGHWFSQQGGKAKKQNQEYIRNARKKGYKLSKSSILGIGSNDNNNRPKSLFQSAMTLLKGFNDMLDKAMKVIAAAKSIKSGSDSSSDKSSGGSSTGGGDNVKGSKSASKNASSIRSYIEKHLKGSQSNAISGLIGNYFQESGLNPTAVSSDGGHGIGQWTGARWTALEKYAKKKGVSWKNLGLQEDFMLNGDTSSGLLKKLLKTKGSVASSTKDIMDKYEVPNAQYANYSNRLNGAKKYGKKHATGGVYSTATDVGGNNVVGDDGLEAAVPLGAGHQGDTEHMLNVIAGTYGKKMVTSPESSGTASGVSIGHYAPSNNVTINGANKTDDELVSKIQTLLSSMKQKDRQSLLNYYSNSYK